jgi:hypothetical protein
MSGFHVEWAYFMEADRLNYSPSFDGNSLGIDLTRKANDFALEGGRVLPRAYGLLSFMILTRWLNNWLTDEEIRRFLADAIADLRAVCDSKSGVSGSSRPTEALNALEQLQASSSNLNQLAIGTVTAYASAAATLDPDDNDTVWSLATANLYAKKYGAALEGYRRAMELADSQRVPEVDKATLRADYADALFFAGNGNGDVSEAEHVAAIREAIQSAQGAIDQIRKQRGDPKYKRWNWTLGWAYYELAAYEDAKANAAKAAELLETLQPKDAPATQDAGKAHWLIQKNIMAANVAAGNVDRARWYAELFLRNNGKYDPEVEDRWPYRPKALARWKRDLGEVLLSR